MSDETCGLCGNTREWHRNPGKSGVHKFAEAMSDEQAGPSAGALRIAKDAWMRSGAEVDVEPFVQDLALAIDEHTRSHAEAAYREGADSTRWLLHEGVQAVEDMQADASWVALVNHGWFALKRWAERVRALPLPERGK